MKPGRMAREGIDEDVATAVGTWITTVDELDLADLDMRARVHREEWSHGSSPRPAD